LSFEQIFENVAQYQCKHVTVTGGEPLAQPDCLPLLTALCDQGYSVSLETSGAIDVSQVDKRVIKIIDLKTPSSGELDKNLYENLSYITPHDQIKFVIGDETDYQWSKKVMAEYDLTNKSQILFSPIYQSIEPRQLADWILQDQLPVRFQIQLHKYLWNDEPGR